MENKTCACILCNSSNSEHMYRYFVFNIKMEMHLFCPLYVTNKKKENDGVNSICTKNVREIIHVGMCNLVSKYLKPDVF